MLLTKKKNKFQPLLQKLKIKHRFYKSNRRLSRFLLEYISIYQCLNQFYIHLSTIPSRYVLPVQPFKHDEDVDCGVEALALLGERVQLKAEKLCSASFTLIILCTSHLNSRLNCRQVALYRFVGQSIYIRSAAEIKFFTVQDFAST